MMICKADFEELFPHLFTVAQRTHPKTIVKRPNEACLRRWEDDGGHPGTASYPREPENSRQTLDSLPWPKPTHSSAILAKAHNHLALSAAWPMLVCLGVARQLHLPGHPRTDATGIIYG
jgi:hypothetical protein